MSEKNEVESHEILYGSAFNPNLIGSKLPPIPPCTFLTGLTESTGPTGSISTNGIHVTYVNNDNVSVISGATNAVISTIPVGSTRQGVGVNPFTNRIYISNANNNNVSVISGAANAVIATISVGGAPIGVRVNP
ncbi:exosporium leader peptide-containing protein [Bacillus thuringiensis]|uniref:YncE family protein n=1 Tax=Bacillus thuringiensis TaxID=1428 RepID=UPI002FBEEE15